MRIQGGGLARHIIVGCLFSLIVCLLLIITIASAEDLKTASDQGKIVITDDDIKKMNVHSMVELLNQIPGVSATETSVKMQGFSVKHILVLLDGRTINNPLDSSRGVNWSTISLNAIEKIEIYKGSGSILYGDNTTGGVISITTKKVAKGSYGKIELSYGRFDSQGYDLNYQQGLRNFGWGLSAGWEKIDGFRANYDKDKKRIGTRFRYKLDKKRDMLLTFDYSQYERGNPGRDYFPTLRARSRDKNWASTFLFPLGRFKSGTHYSSFEQRYDNPDTGMSTIMESWVLTERLSSAISIGRFGQINIGTDFELAHVEGNKIASHEEEKYAIYATKNVRFQGAPLNLNLGFRANFYSVFPITVNPQLQLEYKYDNIDMQFSVSRANNIPTFRQRYYETSFLKANADLKMETAMNYSLSFSSQFEESIEGSTLFFFNDQTDRITYVREGATGMYKNIGSATRKGIETTVKWKPNNFWLIKSSYTFLIAKDEDTGKYLTYSPKHGLTLNIQCKPLQALVLGLDTKYFSRQFFKADNSKSLRGTYLRFDLKADYSLNKNTGLFLKIVNLFDKYYETLDGYPCTPRAWTVGMAYEF